MQIIDVEQGSKEWLELRRLKIGASDAGVIMGVDPYKNVLQLWEEKILGKSGFVSSAMRRGSRLEPIARDIIEKSHNITYSPIVLQSDEYSWMIASLDGYNEEQKKIIEIKCPNDETFNNIIESRDIPLHWVCQMQHQMCVTGLSECLLVVFNGVYCFGRVIRRDDSQINNIIEKEREFFNSLNSWEPPETSLKERTDLEMVEAMHAYLDAVEARKEAEELEKICKEGIIYLSNGESCKCVGKTVRKIIKKGTVDYSKIDILNDMDLSKYRKEPVEYWKIS